MTRPPEPDCARLRLELAVLDAMPHTTDAETQQRETDHARWHTHCPHDYDPGHLPRDPERTRP